MYLIVHVAYRKPPSFISVQYRHLIPAPVDRTFASNCLYYRPWIACQKNKPSTPTTYMYVSCYSKLRSVVRSCMHPFPGNLVAIGRAVVCYAWAAYVFSAGIKCRHCTYIIRGSPIADRCVVMVIDS